MRHIFLSLIISISLLTSLACAGVIVSQGGNDGGANPLGYYAPYGSTHNPGVGVVSWTQTSTFNGVTIYASFFDSSQPASVNYYLVTSIGSGTSFAADGIVEGSASIPANPASVKLGTVASLGPGTYYLVVDSSSAESSWDYGYPSGGAITTASGVTFNGIYSARGGFVNGSYSPASSFFTVHDVYLPLEFSVTASSTPEPATFATAALALLAFAGLRRRV